MDRPRQSGVPLAAVLLMVAIISVLLMVAQPTPMLSAERRPVVSNADSVGMVAGAVGGILGVIVMAYSSPTLKFLMAAYIVGGLTMLFATRLLVEPHNLGAALIGSALLICYGLVIRRARTKISQI